MPRPIILISSGRTLLPARGDDAQSTKVGSDEQYVAAVIRAGGVPLLLPPHGDKEAARASVAIADAVLLTGGGDIHSLVYGAQPHRNRSIKIRRATRPNSSLSISRSKSDCRFWASVAGASCSTWLLVATSSSTFPQVKSGGNTKSQGMAGLLLHTVSLQPDTVLHQLFPVDSMAVNSFHHQAPGRVGEGLRVSARATDGTIEALEASDGRPILGVLFHPEECAPFYQPSMPFSNG